MWQVYRSYFVKSFAGKECPAKYINFFLIWGSSAIDSQIIFNVVLFYKHILLNRILFLSIETKALSGICAWVQNTEVGRKVNGTFSFFSIFNCFWTMISIFVRKASLKLHL